MRTFILSHSASSRSAFFATPNAALRKVLNPHNSNDQPRVIRSDAPVSNSSVTARQHGINQIVAVHAIRDVK